MANVFPEQTNYCFKPNVFDELYFQKPNEDIDSWLLNFISQNKRDDLLEDLIRFHQWLLEKTVHTIHSEYEQCIDFARKCKTIDQLQQSVRLQYENISKENENVKNLELDTLKSLSNNRKQLIDQKHQLEKELLLFHQTLKNDNLPADIKSIFHAYLGMNKDTAADTLLECLSNPTNPDLVTIALNNLMDNKENLTNLLVDDIDADSIESLIDFVRNKYLNFTKNERNLWVGVLLPAIVKKAMKILNYTNLNSSDMGLIIKQLKQQVFEPCREMISFNLTSNCFDNILDNLNLSNRVYYSLRQAEFRAILEHAIVVQSGQCDQSDGDCQLNCCIVHRTILDIYNRTVEDSENTSVLIRPTARYHKYIETLFQKDVKVEYVITSLKVIEKCSGLVKCPLLLKRLTTIREDLIYLKLEKLLCQLHLLEQIENLPSMRPMYRQHEPSSYVNDLLSMMSKYSSTLNKINSEIVDKLMLRIIGQFKDVSLNTLKAVDQVETGLARLRKGSSTLSTNQKTIVYNQLKVDVKAFVEMVKADNSLLSTLVENALNDLESIF